MSECASIEGFPELHSEPPMYDIARQTIDAGASFMALGHVLRSRVFGHVGKAMIATALPVFPAKCELDEPEECDHAEE